MHDLTQPLNAGTPRFPGDPEVRIEAIRESAPWQISELRMGTHSGTHLDAPSHCIVGGAGIGAYPPDRLLGGGFVINAMNLDENEAIPASILETVRDKTWPGWFAVMRTGWDLHWSDARYFRHPYLSPELAKELVATKAGIVAIDALSVDSTGDGGSEAHFILLGADVLIAENLCNLGSLEPSRHYTFAFLPLSLGSADGSPGRVVAWDPLDTSVNPPSGKPGPLARELA